LEFLGNAILNFLSATYLYSNYPDAPAGRLSASRANIVNNKSLAKESDRLNMISYLRHNDYLLTGDGPKLRKTKADIYEALLGAIFFDSGLEKCKEFTLPYFRKFENTLFDPKNTLQHLAQVHFSALPVYNILSMAAGLYQECKAEVLISGVSYGTGVGNTNKEATQDAAIKALDIIQKKINIYLSPA